MPKTVPFLSSNPLLNSQHLKSFNLDNQVHLLQRLIDHIAEELLLINKEGQIVYVNEAAVKGIGYPRETLLSQSILTFYKEPMTLSQWQKKYFIPLRKRRKPLIYNVRRIVKGGQAQSIQVTAVYMRFQSEEYLLSVSRDISERMNMELSLKESQDRYRLISECAADGIFTIDLKGRVTYANRALAEIMGISLKESLGTHFRSYVTKDSLPKAYSCFKMASRGHPRIREEIEIIGRNKEIIPVEVSGSPLYKNEKIVAIHAIVRDIRKRRRLEDLLKESEKKYKDLFEDANDALIITDLKGVILDVNRQSENLFKRSKLEMLGILHESLFPKSQVATFRQLFKESLSGNVKALDLEIVDRQNRHIPVSVLGRRVHVAEHDVFLGRFTDLSERIEKEAKTRDSNKMSALNLFISGTAQEIKYPLEMIQVHLKGLLNKYQNRNFEYIGYKEFRHIMTMLRNIFNEVRHCHSITEKLLAINRRQLGIKRRGCQVNDVLKKTVKSFAQELKRTKSKIDWKLAARIPPAAIGAVELEEVVTCLLENAIQAMSGGGSIMIVSRFRKQDGKVEVEFKDQGEGISREHMERVFEPFFTTKQVSSDKSFGLGLSIVYSIIKESQGDVSIKSRPGHGTQVKVTLPVFSNQVKSTEGRPS